MPFRPFSANSIAPSFPSLLLDNPRVVRKALFFIMFEMKGAPSLVILLAKRYNSLSLVWS